MWREMKEDPKCNPDDLPDEQQAKALYLKHHGSSKEQEEKTELKNIHKLLHKQKDKFETEVFS